MDNQMVEQLEDEAREVEELIFLCKDPVERKKLEDQRQRLSKQYLDAHNIH